MQWIWITGAFWSTILEGEWKGGGKVIQWKIWGSFWLLKNNVILVEFSSMYEKCIWISETALKAAKESYLKLKKVNVTTCWANWSHGENVNSLEKNKWQRMTFFSHLNKTFLYMTLSPLGHWLLIQTSD